VITELVSLRDIPATVAGLVGLGKDSPFPGESLVRFWDGSKLTEASSREPLLMETDTPPFFTNQGREPASKGPMKSLVAEGLHYIRRADGVEEMYDLDADPTEKTDVALYPKLIGAIERFRERLSAIGQKK
jgi:hypothetical protein